MWAEARARVCVCMCVWGCVRWALMLLLTYCIQAQHKYSEWTLHTVLHSPCVLISSLQPAALRLNTVDCVLFCVVLLTVMGDLVLKKHPQVCATVYVRMCVWWCCICYCCCMFGSLYKIARLQHSLLYAYLTCTGYRNKAIPYSNMQILMETSTKVLS